MEKPQDFDPKKFFEQIKLNVDDLKIENISDVIKPMFAIITLQEMRIQLLTAGIDELQGACRLMIGEIEKLQKQ